MSKPPSFGRIHARFGRTRDSCRNWPKPVDFWAKVDEFRQVRPGSWSNQPDPDPESTEFGARSNFHRFRADFGLDCVNRVLPEIGRSHPGMGQAWISRHQPTQSHISPHLQRESPPTERTDGHRRRCIGRCRSPRLCSAFIPHVPHAMLVCGWSTEDVWAATSSRCLIDAGPFTDYAGVALVLRPPRSPGHVFHFHAIPRLKMLGFVHPRRLGLQLKHTTLPQSSLPPAQAQATSIGVGVVERTKRLLHYGSCQEGLDCAPHGLATNQFRRMVGRFPPLEAIHLCDESSRVGGESRNSAQAEPPTMTQITRRANATWRTDAYAIAAQRSVQNTHVKHMPTTGGQQQLPAHVDRQPRHW